MKQRIFLSCLWLGLILSGCIENDLPERVVVCGIEEMQVQGMVSCKITDASRTVDIKVSDTLDVRNVRVEKLIVTDKATIYADTAACLDFEHFPKTGFVSADSLSGSADTRVNFRNPVSFRLRLYQEYDWTVNVTHEIVRKIKVKNQIGSPLIDENTKHVVIYVDSVSQPSFRNIELIHLQLGSSVAETVPDPALVTDFTRPRIFYVTAFGETEEWTVSIQYPTANVQTTELSAWTRRAYLKGTTLSGDVSVTYRVKGETEWESVLSNEISYEDGEFMAMMTHLRPLTTYEYQSVIDNKTGEVNEFTTDSVRQVPNLSFEDWTFSSNAWYPNVDMEEANHFWDSGNEGASIIQHNPTGPETKDVVKGKAIRMASEYIGMASQFAAGNIYSGDYIKTRMTDEGNGAELDFGRPYSSRPSGLKGYYKYNSGTIDYAKPPYDYLLGQKDSCHIYVALFSDWSSSFRVNTVAGVFVDLSWKNESLLAFGEFKTDKTSTGYQPFRINLTYRNYFTKPTYILIVATASKYGDYFSGSTGSVLMMDECELVFE